MREPLEVRAHRAEQPRQLLCALTCSRRLDWARCTARVSSESADPCRPLVLLLLLLDPQVRRAPGRLATLQAQAGHSLEPDFLICVRVALTRRLSRAVLPPTSSCRLESGRPPPPSSPSRETASAPMLDPSSGRSTNKQSWEALGHMQEQGGVERGWTRIASQTRTTSSLALRRADRAIRPGQDGLADESPSLREQRKRAARQRRRRCARRRDRLRRRRARRSPSREEPDTASRAARPSRVPRSSPGISRRAQGPPKAASRPTTSCSAARAWARRCQTELARSLAPSYGQRMPRRVR